MSESLYWQPPLSHEAMRFFLRGGDAVWREGDSIMLGCHCRDQRSHALEIPEGTWVTWSEGRFYLGLPHEG